MARMMGLGPFRFGLETAAYQKLIRADEYRWQSQERIGRHPAMQFLGAGHTTISLDGVIYPEFRGGFAQLDRMRFLAGLGTPHMLVSGTGRIFGLFVIESVDERQAIFHRDGSPRKQEFGLFLSSYGADGAVT